MTDPSPPSQPDYRALLTRSLAAIQQLESKLAAVEQARVEPIAIVGMGCRFPRGANDVEAFWRLLRDGVDGVTEVPADRWSVADIYDPDPDAVGKTYSKWGGFLDQVDKFDAPFFGISPREAASIDPQHRLLLEVAWEALENAGIAPPSLAGSRTAFYLGISTHDYANEYSERVGLDGGDAYAAAGVSHAIAAGRAAYFLGLHGPNASIDTACSSSSMAIHLAVQSLRGREANVALAAGVNLTLSPTGSILTSRARMMAFDGRCKTFDAAADGYVRAEGCGVLVLKRLSDARRDDDRILAVIRGTAANQDGRSSGLTAPNGVAQEAVIRDALANARLAPDDIDFIEAHGTGTSLGDPIEINALQKVFGQREATRPLSVSSVKTNIGHAEGAAGIAGVIKTVLALQHRQIPPHLHLRTPNPLIPWNALRISVPVELSPWVAREGQPRRAGVSSFGFSGTNTHIVLEEAPVEGAVFAEPESTPQLLVLSAQTPTALREQAARFRDYLGRADAAPLRDVAFTAGVGRAHFVERVALVAQDGATAAELLDVLLASTENTTTPGVAGGRSPSGSAPEIAFLFTGQGAQRFGMARELYETRKVFRETLDACAAVIDPIVGRSLVDVMFRDDNARALLDDTAFTQPALFAVEVALAQLWRSWGVEPAMMLGHSVGEYVAAYVAGVFSLEDGARLIAHRGRLMSALPRDGAMVAVFADHERVMRAIEGFAADVSVAGVNGPTNTVIAGRAAAIDTILDRLAADGVEFQRLNVSHAFHSPLMDPMLDEFERIAATVAFHSPRIGVVSNITGKVAGAEIATASYWRRHVRAGVLFSDGIATLLAEGVRTFLEIGPSPTLTRMAQRCDGAANAAWLSSLRKERGDTEALLETLGELYVRGQTIVWRGVAGTEARRVALPTYPFQRERHWHDLTPRGRKRLASAGRDTHHPLLGSRIPGPLHVYQNTLALDEAPWLGDHRILDLALFPATGFVEVALSAARDALGERVVLEDVVIRDRLALPDTGAITVQVVVTQSPDGVNTVDVYSAVLDASATRGSTSSDWRRHMSATVVTADAEMLMTTRTLSGERVDHDVAEHYARLFEHGARYGPAFQGIRELARAGQELLARVELPADLARDARAMQVHPALLDACLQAVGAGLTGEGIFVPAAIERVRVFQPGVAKAWCRVTIESAPAAAASVRADVVLLDDDGRAVAEVRGLVFRRVSRGALEGHDAARVQNDWLYEVHWQSSPVPAAPAPTGRWLVIGDEGVLLTSFAERLARDGCTVVTVAHDAVVGADDKWRFDATDASHYRRLVAQVSRDSSGTWAGVVMLAGAERSEDSALRDSLDPALDSLEKAHASRIALLLAATPVIAELGAPLWVVTRGSQWVDDSIPDLSSAPVWGLAGVIASEYPSMRTIRVDLDPVGSSGEIDLLITTLGARDREDRVALRGGRRYVARLTPGTLVSHDAEQPRRLEITERGVLENLTLAPFERMKPGQGEIEIRVAATGLNFRDVLNALGMYPGDPGPLGNECAGVITAVGEGVHEFAVGDDVITMVDSSFATHVIARAALTVRKPSNITFAEAATIPVAFLTAEYALIDLARLEPGQRVLIHAATGGVGMAALQIARRAGAEVFATAGTEAKRELARRLGAHHVADSRSLSFAADVKRDAGNQGVDVVLNSLAGDFIPASLGLLRHGGRFVEIGKTGIWDATAVAAAFPGLEYHPLYLGEITAAQPERIRAHLQRIVDDVASGLLAPLPTTLYPLERAESAFRFMGQGRHTGKIVITQRIAPPVRAHATYLITGGLGGLGLACARDLADRGARSLVLVARRAPSAESSRAVDELRRAGVSVVVAAVDVAESTEVAALLERIAQSLPPLHGVIHAAGVVDDAMIADQNLARFATVMAPKVAGSWHLHRLTRGLPLDFFVMFSAGAALLGSPGQGNYAAANAFMDALAFVREAAGRPALSVNWGSWAEVGMASEVGEHHRRRWAEQGLKTILPAEGVRMLHDALQGALMPNVAILPLDRTRLPQGLAPFFERLIVAEPVARARVDASADIRRQIAGASPEERRLLVTAFLTDQITRVLAIDRATRLRTDLSVMEMGLDSLMAMELRNRVQSALQVRVSVADLLAGPTIDRLSDSIVDAMHADSATADRSGGLETSNVDQLSDAEVNAALAELLGETAL